MMKSECLSDTSPRVWDGSDLAGWRSPLWPGRRGYSSHLNSLVTPAESGSASDSCVFVLSSYSSCCGFLPRRPTSHTPLTLWTVRGTQNKHTCQKSTNARRGVAPFKWQPHFIGRVQQKKLETVERQSLALGRFPCYKGVQTNKLKKRGWQCGYRCLPLVSIPGIVPKWRNTGECARWKSRFSKNSG